ncbi:MAG: glycoside hydrolase 43 family protein [Paludibacter sp.]|nr:glycoside hydrolase 43 family protein [Paludibacter sp.]
MKNTLFLLFFFISFAVNAQFSPIWGDQGDGTYANPVIPADYSDIDAIRVGSDFYAISSTFQYSPGVVVLHSKDLVNWEIIGHVANDITTMTPELNWDKMNRYGKGVWAGSIRYYKNKFWVYYGTPDEGFFMSSASNPAGPWEPLHCLLSATGWDDCCPFLDDDGQFYFVATNFAKDPTNNKKYNIHLFKMTPDGKSLILESDSIIHQSNGSEANKMYKINGMYYHYFSEVNREGRVIMMERSKSIYGPWEIKQLNHVNKKEDREPNQGGLIQLETGKWYFFTHHGSGDWDGRVATLLPVTWVDGWPVIGKVGDDKIGNMVWDAPKPIVTKKILKIQTDDDFSSGKLLPQWEWHYQPRADKWSLSEREGYLRLYAFKPIDAIEPRQVILRAGNTITQRTMRTAHNEAVVKIDIQNMTDGQFAGITHFSTKTYSLFGIKQTNGIRCISYDNNGIETSGVVFPGKSVWLKSTWGYDGVNRYAYSTNGKMFTDFGDTYSFSWGSYRGDRLGIFNFNIFSDMGFIDVDWLRYRYASSAK